MDKDNRAKVLEAYNRYLNAIIEKINLNNEKLSNKMEYRELKYMKIQIN